MSKGESSLPTPHARAALLLDAVDLIIKPEAGRDHAHAIRVCTALQEEAKSCMSETRSNVPPTPKEIQDTLFLFRAELDKNMHNSSGSPGHDAMHVALHKLFETRRNAAPQVTKEMSAPTPGATPANAALNPAATWPFPVKP